MSGKEFEGATAPVYPVQPQPTYIPENGKLMNYYI